MHAFTAPTPGTGKSYLVSVANAIAAGQRCPVIAAGQTEEETEKRLGGLALSGQAIICIDNLNGEIGGDFLAQLVEQQMVTVRILGGNSGKHIARIENRATVFANGNNMTPRADSIRRTLLCSLDANMERPETRKFSKDPFAEVIANRGRYIAAVLTIVRAHAAAGYPCKPSPYASFEEWSTTVRAALMWLGCADPLLTQDDAQDEDPDKMILGAIMEGLMKLGGDVTTAQLVQLADEREGPTGTDYKRPDLRLALIDAAGFRGEIDTRRLGYFLKAKKGKVVDGLKLTPGKASRSKQNSWSAVSLKAAR
jgi:putative DNA primase/helicase